MKLRWVYGVIPVPIFKSRGRLLKPWQGGHFCGLFIVIRDKYWNDEPLLEHELQHARQFWRSLGLYALLYRFSRKYRLAYEVEAYHVQYKLAPKYLSAYAHLLACFYNVNVTILNAREMIKKGTVDG